MEETLSTTPTIDSSSTTPVSIAATTGTDEQDKEPPLNTSPKAEEKEEKEVTKVERKVPVFRVTVLWDLPQEKQVVRVYEGFTPQQVWQAAMIERIGTKDSDIPMELDTSEADLSPDADGEIDEEETALRKALSDARKKYIKMLKSQQVSGARKPIQPRIPIEAIDNLFDEFLLRMVEGMDGSLACQHYDFLDSRIKDSNNLKFLKVNYIRYMATVQSKFKHLERIIRKNLTLKVRNYFTTS